ncbi:MAG: hypothetical protein HZA00_07410 [Nitrospinae bacterium]|nr:hypothetical protein [Nitrospinota bacterium]
MTHKILILFAFCSLFFLSCDRSGFLTGPSTNSTSNSGSLTFKLELKGGSNGSSELRFASSFDCTANGVNTVDVKVYYSTSSSPIASGSWLCLAHSGTISNVSASSGLNVVILGKNPDGDILYRGEQSGITVTANQTTNVGTITVSNFIPTLVSPANNSTISSLDFAWRSSVINYGLQISESNTFSTLVGGAMTDINSATTSLMTLNPAGSKWYWRVRAVDSNGNVSKWSDMWSFTSAGITNGLVTRTVTPG